jgi:signal transduction histidine kinase
MSFQEKIGEKYYECNISLLKQNNKIYGSLIIIRDVTMSVSYENRIKNMNEHLRIINKILRHDISNHLTAASLSIEMLEMGDVELRDRAQRSISRSLDLINRMKTLEMVISGHGQLKGYRLSDIMRDIIKNYPNIDFNINGDCTALADDAIVSVIDNIVNNAILHSGTEKIDIEIEKREGFCIINVIDYGKGIPAHIKDHIYNNEYSYGENKGTGIGLFIVKKTVERYGGDIKVTDNEPNGTKFTLILKKDNKSF